MNARLAKVIPFPAHHVHPVHHVQYVSRPQRLRDIPAAPISWPGWLMIFTVAIAAAAFLIENCC